MPEYTYTAMANSGQRSSGTLTATTERDALAQLDARGLFPLEIKPAATAAQGWTGFRRVSARHLAACYSQLADLLHSGVPLLRALEIIERQCSVPALAEVLREVRARVADGSGLAEALAQHPRVFDELAVSMVRAGQEGGFLEDVLKRIADFTENQEELKAKVVGALIYPIVLTVAGGLVLALLMTFVVPLFEPMFKRLREKGELPWLTSGLMSVSQFMLSWTGLLGIALFVLTAGAIWRWTRTPGGRHVVDRWKLRLPIAGTFYLHLAIARFARILGTLLHNGIPILQALRIAKDSTGNLVLTEAIERAAENVTVGSSLAAPLAASQHFPRDVVEMIAVGQESNNLENVLVNLAASMEKRTSRKLDLFVKMLEPVMLLVMAVLVLTIVASLMMPIFKMSSAIR